MTTTQLFSGFAPGEKNSSRVLRPPGGGSNITFGGSDEPEKPQPRKEASKTVNPISGQTEETSRTPQAAAPEKPKESVSTPECPPAAGGSSKSTPTDQKPSGAYNIITGESIPVDKQTPSTRVRQPPGGASSKLW